MQMNHQYSCNLQHRHMVMQYIHQHQSNCNRRLFRLQTLKKKVTKICIVRLSGVNIKIRSRKLRIGSQVENNSVYHCGSRSLEIIIEINNFEIIACFAQCYNFNNRLNKLIILNILKSTYYKHKINIVIKYYTVAICISFLARN